MGGYVRAGEDERAGGHERAGGREKGRAEYGEALPMSAVAAMARLARAGFVLAQYGVRLVPEGQPVPWPVRLAWLATLPWQALTWPFRHARKRERGARIAAALTRLGPSYIKLGQFLAARPDLVGERLASDLSELQDRMAPFSMAEARAAVEEALEMPLDEAFAEFGPPVAAASIAQVHKAIVEENGRRRPVAVKVLRPGVEQRFQRDLESYYFAARQIERFHPPARRLRPVAVVETLARTTAIEMDLRMEAAAISEFAENTREDDDFRVPALDWQRTARRVLTLEWIDATPIAAHDRLRAAGHDLDELGNRLIRSFLRHAMRDGFFHADMHQGNLFVDDEGRIVAVDFGIVGRLGPRERRFLAEILYGFITRDYRRAADVHFWAGYVPRHHRPETFAQALRAIGEPIMDRTADEISMGHLLGQLFQYTGVFDMQTRPELILLQKTMVVVEGVARALSPRLNIWTAGEPVVREWMERELGAEGRLREAREGAETLGKLVGEIPGLLAQAERTAVALGEMAEGGIRLDDETIARLAAQRARKDRWLKLGVWLGALSLAALAVLAALRSL